MLLRIIEAVTLLLLYPMNSVSTILLCLAASASLSNIALAEECNTKDSALLLARGAVSSREAWPHGADYNVSRDGADWRVTANRIDYPEHKGSARYAPGGFRLILISNTGEVRKYSCQ